MSNWDIKWTDHDKLWCRTDSPISIWTKVCKPHVLRLCLAFRLTIDGLAIKKYGNFIAFSYISKLSQTLQVIITFNLTKPWRTPTRLKKRIVFCTRQMTQLWCQLYAAKCPLCHDRSYKKGGRFWCKPSWREKGLEDV
jgi:hypothetical protein